MTLDFEEEKLIKELKKAKPKRVLIQLPEGIKSKAIELSKKIQSLGIEAIISGETCWGGCAVAVEEAKTTNCDLIIHFGHAEFFKANFPVVYIEIKDNIEILPLIKKSLPLIKDFKKLGISYSVQHKHKIKEIIDFYKKSGKEVLLSKKQGHAAYEGHVIGCEYSGLKSIEKEADAFIVLGNNFHSMGAALSVNKPVFLVDVYNNEITNMSLLKEKIIKQRFASIEKFRKAKTIGILIETKQGQKFGSPNTLIKSLKESGKESILITMSEITPDKLTNFNNIGAFIELACPRIAVDDFFKYPKPILTYREALAGLDKIELEDLMKNGFW